MTTQPSTDLEQRVSRLEGAYEQVNERLGDISRGQDALRAEMNEGQNALRAEMHEGQNALRAEMHEGFAALRAEMNSRFNIFLVLLGTLWATTVGGFIALFTRL